MTITDTVKLNSDTTQAYAKNQQVVVMKADKVADYTTVESLQKCKPENFKSFPKALQKLKSY